MINFKLNHPSLLFCPQKTNMYYRKKHGRGFRYTDEKGKTIKDKKLKAWFHSLVIPPAWTEVEISDENSKELLAVGRDAKGRKQYIYHPEYIKQRTKQKFDRIIEFARQLEKMRDITDQHLRKRKMNKEKVLATMVRLMDEAYFRPGNPYYTKENQSYGLTTLRSKHLEITGNRMTFSYTGKSGQPQEHEINDKKLATTIRDLDEIPGYRIFKYFDEEGEKHEVNSDELNEYIRGIMGKEFSAKDFRTWAGTLIAAVALDKLNTEEIEDDKNKEKNIRAAVEEVADRLGNTPAVAKSSYIDPRIIAHYMDGKTIKNFQEKVKDLLLEMKNLSPTEACVLHMLEH